MFKESTIKDCFFGLAQFEQPLDPSYPTLDNDLVTSITGRSINRVHSLLTIENIFNCAPDFRNYVFPNWVTGVDIKKGQILAYSGSNYLVLNGLTALQNTVAPNVSNNFSVTNAFSSWLRELSKQSAIQLATLLIQHKKLNQLTKDNLESTMLYEGGALLTEREIGQNRFVGYAITVRENQNLVTTINSIGIQLDQALGGNLKMYLYHSSCVEPVAIAEINGDGGLTFTWTDVVGFELRSVDFSKYDNGGTFFLGYYEADLGPSQAISKKMDISRPCSTCNRYNQTAYRTWNRRFQLASMYVAGTDIKVDKTLFDINKVIVNNDRNYGLNFSINVNCDTSSFFCRNKNLFADAYSKLVAVNLMKEIAYSTRINSIPEMTRSSASSELDPKANSGSLLDDFNKALKAVDYDFSGLDSDCLPCDNRQRIHHGAI